MDSAPAVRKHLEQTILVKDIELDGKTKDGENEAHQDKALEARPCQPRIGGVENCCEFFAVFPYAVHDQYYVKSASRLFLQSSW